MCLYVGMTSKSPKIDLNSINEESESKGQDISSQIVFKYGTFLRPSLYQHLPTYQIEMRPGCRKKN